MGTRERLLNLTPNVLPRFDQSDLASILARKGYGIASSLPKRSIASSIDSTRKEHDLEHAALDESVGTKRIQIRCREKIRVRVTFYRRRLADYSRAISEKAIVDCFVKSGLLSGDSEKEIWYEDGGQKKVESNEEERTEVELFYPEVDFDNLWEENQRTDGR